MHVYNESYQEKRLMGVAKAWAQSQLPVIFSRTPKKELNFPRPKEKKMILPQLRGNDGWGRSAWLGARVLRPRLFGHNPRGHRTI
jgi:hypothetical protein